MRLQWARWLAGRAAMLPLVWFLAHVTIFVWKAVDPNYLVYSKWVAAYILVPLHPTVVWLVKSFVPAFQTYVGNTLPTHENAPTVWYPLCMGAIGFVGALLWALVRTPQKSPTEHHIVRYWIGWSLRRALLFPAVWVVTHVTVFLWRASDPSYLSTSEWVAQYILKPIHPYTVSVVGWIIPFGSTYLANLEPTHEDAVKIYYPLIMSAFGLLVLGGYLGIVAIVEHMRAPIIIAPPRRSLQAAIRTGRPTSRIPTRSNPK